MRCFELNLTYRCNQRCRYCDRLRDLVDLDGDASLEQIDRLCRWIVDEGMHFGRLKLSGGEPLLHPQILEIVNRFSQLPRANVHRITLLTNGTTETIRFRDPRVGYWESPLSEKHHVPVLISPADHLVTGWYGTNKSCPLTRKCGACWDCYGFTPCPPAGAFGHALGINPYSPTFILRGGSPVCRHCFMSMGREVRAAMLVAVAAGTIEHPSHLYRIGLEKLKENPILFRRW